MRISYTFILLILLTSCKTSTNMLSAEIIDVDNIENPVTNIEAYHHKDVKVFRQASENRIIYALTLFRINNDTLRPYIGNITTLNTYDTAQYEWVNDSTVTIILKNNFHSEKLYTLSGYGRTSSLSWD